MIRIFLNYCLLIMLTLAAPVIYAEQEATSLKDYSTLESVQKISQNQKILKLLQSVLGNDYPAFVANAENWGAPAQLKDGGLYVEVWRNSDSPIRQTSAFVLYSDGTVYAAFSAPGAFQIKYATNNLNEKFILPLALQVWYRQFNQSIPIITIDFLPVQNKKSILPSSGSSTNGVQFVTPYAREVWGDEERNRVSAVASAIWAPYIVANWDINPDVADLVGAAVNSIRLCSQAMALIPEPTFLPNRGYIIEYFEQLPNKIVGVLANQTYKVCVNQAALNYQSPIEMASLGV